MKNKDAARILIVDDQIHALQGVSRIMKGAGYEVLEASNGTDCLRLAMEYKPDLILLDVVLPDIDGREVCRRIKSDSEIKDIYVVLLASMQVESDRQAEGLEQGADGYIARPIPNRELLARVKSILRLKFAENRWRESEERFRNMFEGHHAVMLLIEPEGGRIVDANKAAEQFYGYTMSQLRSMSIQDINVLPPDEVEAQRNLAIKEQRNYFFFPHRLANGEVRTVEVHSSPVDQNGALLLFSIIHDITERKQVEESLKLSEARYRIVSSITSDIAYSCCRPTDAAYSIDWMTGATERILGYSVEDIKSLRCWRDLVVEEDWPIFDSRVIGISPGTSASSELRLRHRDGNIVYLSSFAECVLESGSSDGLRLYGGLVDITERKRLDQNLAESEKRYRLITETIRDCFWMATPDIDKMLYVSPAYETIWGRSCESLYESPRSLFETIHPDDRDRVLDILTKHRHQGTPFTITYRIIRPDGFTRWIEDRSFPVLDENGKWNLNIGVATDITERKHMEDALQKSEKFLEQVVENIPDMIFVKDAENLRFVRFNKAGEDLLGYDREDLLGKNDYDFFPAAQAEFFVAKDKAVLVEGKLLDIPEEEISTKNHGKRILHTKKIPIPNADGTAQFLLGISQDITDHKQSEEKNLRLAAIVESSDDAIIGTTVDGTITSWNKGAERLYGYKEHEVVGKSITILTPHDREDEILGFLEQIKSGKSVKPFETVRRKKDGDTVTASLTISPIIDKAGDIIGASTIFRDISDRVKAAMERQALQEQLLQAQKMEAVGTLAGGIAHDFNNLLQVVLGYSEFMLQCKKEGEPDYDSLQKIYQAGKRGADLVGSLLTFSRKVETKLVPVNLNQEITQVQHLLSRTIPKTININLNFKGNLESIKADLSQIGQVLMNLGVNARDAMPDGGTLTFETTNVQLDEEYCNSHREAKPGGYVLLTVSDTGQGMDKETLSHIFEPFFTTKETGKGTGLGLATVYGIVKQHGGHITCHSLPGLGTTFNIYFPAIEKERVSKTLTVEMPIPGGTETILLVDDEESIRDFATTLLNNFGYKVITASNGKEALEIYQRDGHSISLTILDLIMPVMDGRQFLTGVLRINPDAKIVIASGASEGGPASEARVTGAKGFVQKPYDMRQLLTRIRDILDTE